MKADVVGCHPNVVAESLNAIWTNHLLSCTMKKKKTKKKTKKVVVVVVVSEEEEEEEEVVEVEVEDEPGSLYESNHWEHLGGEKGELTSFGLDYHRQNNGGERET